MRRIPPLLALLAATLLLMWVAFADGRPTVFYDSHSYDVMGRNLIETIRDWPQSNQNKYTAAIKRGETVVFSYIVYRSRADRNRVVAKVMKDKRIGAMMQSKNVPFDGKRMIVGGFKTIVSA